MRFGTGPVFAYERVAAARRWYLYAGRSLLVAGLLVAMATIALSEAAHARMTTREYAKLGERYFYALIGVELAIVMLAAPAATAGAICQDRARGNLALMLVTDLSDSEIVLGKLGARLLPILGLVAGSWPVMAISTLLGGIDPTALTLAFGVILVVGLVGCAMSLALSVWARQTHEVLMATYTVLGLVLMACPIWYGMSRSGAFPRPPAWVLYANPVFLSLAPYWAPGTATWREYAGFFGVSLGLSAGFALLAVWGMRRSVIREAGRAGKTHGMSLLGRIVRLFPAPSIDANPVLWREWHRVRPSPWTTLLIGLLLGMTTVCCMAGAVAMFIEGVKPQPVSIAKYSGVYGFILEVMFGLLMLSAIAPTALAEERRRGSLDVLLTTPLSTREIVMGKWWGTFRLVPLLAVGPGIMAFAMANGPADAGAKAFSPDGLTRSQLLHGNVLMVATVLAHGAFVVSIGLGLATWIHRQSRAMAMSVAAYILVAVAWPVCYFLLVKRGHARDALPTLSPIVTCASLLEYLTSRNAHFGQPLWGATIWAGLVMTASLGLLEATVRTFDRCLGRMPEQGSPIVADPAMSRPVYDAVLIDEREGG